MRYAIFSDVHNNASALSSTLMDAARHNIDAYLCLGDVGTDPSVELVRNVNAATLFGNWEVSGWRYLSPTNRQWALNLPPMQKLTGFWISHAAPAWPNTITSLQTYLKHQNTFSMASAFPYYSHESQSLWKAVSELLEADIPVLFHGHTHKQIIWDFSPDNQLHRRVPRQLTLAPNHTYIIGVGSVGQPKDSVVPGYVIFDSATKTIAFNRVMR